MSGEIVRLNYPFYPSKSSKFLFLCIVQVCNVKYLHSFTFRFVGVDLRIVLELIEIWECGVGTGVERTFSIFLLSKVVRSFAACKTCLVFVIIVCCL